MDNYTPTIDYPTITITKLNYPVITKSDYVNTRTMKVTILEHHDLWLSIGKDHREIMEIIKNTDIFQDKKAQEFIETLQFAWLRRGYDTTLDEIHEHYSKLINDDLEIYYVLTRKFVPEELAHYLRNKNSYSEPKQLLARIEFLTSHGYSFHRTCEILSLSERNSLTQQALNTRKEDKSIDPNMFKSVLPKHINSMFSSLISESNFSEPLVKLLKLDF